MSRSWGEARARDGASRSRRHRSIAALAAGIMVGACGASDPATRPMTETTAAPSTTTTSLPTTSDQQSISLAHESGSVVATEAGIWVFPHLDPVAVRIGRDGAVQQEVKLSTYATAAAGGDGMLWARTEGDEDSYTRIDPRTGEVLARIADVPGDSPIIAEGFLWAVGSDGTLLRVDPRTSRVDRASVQSAGPFLLTAARGKVWTLGVDGLVGVDPRSLTTTAPWRPITVLGHRPDHMASAGGNLLFTTPNTVAEVDPIAHTKIGESPAPTGTRPLGPAQVGGREPQLVWAFHTYPDAIPNPPRGGRPAPVTIARIDPTAGTTEVITSAPFPEFQGMALDGDTLWIGPLRERRIVRLSVA